VLGLSAGLWEELARYASFRWWARDARTWRKGVLVGAGHGGVEAIILGVLVLVTFVGMLATRDVDLSTLVAPDQIDLARQQVETYWSAPWPLTLFGALERALTIPVQIALSVLVLQTFIRRQWFWVWLAVLWHAIADAGAVYVNAKWGVYAAEATVAACTLISLGMLFALRRPEPEPGENALPESPLGPPANAESLMPREDIPEDLDKTRYSG
jgi:uncharacterized membrane protein YhfC